METFSCPKCGQPMEADSDPTGRQTTCIACGEKFYPVRADAALPVQQSVSALRRNARLIMWFAAALAVIALLVFVCALLEWRSDAAAAHGEDSAPWFSAAFWFLKAALGLYIVAQITFIRANTEK